MRSPTFVVFAIVTVAQLAYAIAIVPTLNYGFSPDKHYEPFEAQISEAGRAALTPGVLLCVFGYLAAGVIAVTRVSRAGAIARGAMVSTVVVMFGSWVLQELLFSNLVLYSLPFGGYSESLYFPLAVLVRTPVYMAINVGLCLLATGVITLWKTWPKDTET